MTRGRPDAAIETDPEGVFRLRPEYVRAAFDDEVLLHHLGRGETLSLNLTAGIILDLMDGERFRSDCGPALGRRPVQLEPGRRQLATW